MKKILATLAVIVFASSAMAAPLAGVTVNDFSGNLGGSWSPDKTLDGSASTFWYSEIPSTGPYVTYDLGGTTILDSLTITMSSGNFRKLAIADILVSTDGVSFTSLGLYTIDTTNGAVTTADVPDTSAAYVKVFGAQAFYSNWSPNNIDLVDGPTVDRYGISYAEITFEAVPEPASLGLLAMGGLMMIARRR